MHAVGNASRVHRLASSGLHIALVVSAHVRLSSLIADAYTRYLWEPYPLRQTLHHCPLQHEDLGGSLGLRIGTRLRRTWW